MDRVEELLARVEAATGPDRALDHAIYDALKPKMEVYSTFAPSGNMDAHWYWMLSREYTASIDAALALVERRIPSCMWRLQSDPDSGDGFTCTLVTPDPMEAAPRGDGATPALAILAALLRSRSSHAEDRG